MFQPHRSTKRAALLALAVSLLIAGCSSSGRRDDSGRVVNDEQDRSPFLATLIAIFPGFFVHGLGNYYAGKHARFEELAAEGGLGTAALVVGGVLGGLGYLEDRNAEKADKDFLKVYHRIGEVSSFLGAAAFAGFGLVCFFDSWIRDIAEAGSATEEKNRARRRQYDTLPIVGADPAADLPAGAPSSKPTRAEGAAELTTNSPSTDVKLSREK